MSIIKCPLLVPNFLRALLTFRLWVLKARQTPSVKSSLEPFMFYFTAHFSALAYDGHKMFQFGSGA